MYSVVMMAALTSAPDVPQFNGYFRDLFSRDGNGCGGCNGCSGAPKYNCSGGCSGVTAASNSCTGCGGGNFLGVGDRVRKWFDRDNGNCCGARSFGCSGASYACSGYSCTGSAYSCFGGPVYPYTPMNFGGMPGIPYAVPDPAPGVGFRPAPVPATFASNAPTARASVVVKLPADARLFADGRQLNLTGAERKFVSPELPTDQEFAYRFKAEYERGGETVSVTKTVNVRAGLTVAVEFGDLTAAKPGATAFGTPTATGANKGTTPVAKPTEEPVKVEPPVKPVVAPVPATDLPGGDRATITVKLPPGATLYVDDRKSPSLDPVRSFSTPPLPTGREFAYTIKAELMRNGQPETLSQKVPFRAGERIVVDFTSLAK